MTISRFWTSSVVSRKSDEQGVPSDRLTAGVLNRTISLLSPIVCVGSEKQMTAEQCYTTVNGILTSLGQPTIPVPVSGSEDERLRKLFDAYVEALLKQVPMYRNFSNRTSIPDAMVQMLVSELRSRKMI